MQNIFQHQTSNEIFPKFGFEALAIYFEELYFQLSSQSDKVNLVRDQRMGIFGIVTANPIDLQCYDWESEKSVAITYKLIFDDGRSMNLDIDSQNQKISFYSPDGQFTLEEIRSFQLEFMLIKLRHYATKMSSLISSELLVKISDLLKIVEDSSSKGLNHIQVYEN